MVGLKAVTETLDNTTIARKIAELEPIARKAAMDSLFNSRSLSKGSWSPSPNETYKPKIQKCPK